MTVRKRFQLEPARHRPELAGQQVEQQPVLPRSVRGSPVAAHDPDPPEADPLVAAARSLAAAGSIVRRWWPRSSSRCRARIPHASARRPLSVALGREEDVDPRVPEVGRRLLVELDHPDDVPLPLDGQPDRVVSSSPTAYSPASSATPISGHQRATSGAEHDLDEPFEVALLERAEEHAFTLRAQCAEPHAASLATNQRGQAPHRGLTPRVG